MPANPLKTGLFAARYFIPAGDEIQSADTLYSLNTELSPQGILEETFAIEIMGAAWRLRRCRNIEAAFTGELDPMIDEKTEKAQKSVDRARAQSHLILRRSIVELRVLQAKRQNRIVKTEDPSSFCNPAPPAPNPPSSFCNSHNPYQAISNKIPRNAPCTCHSGLKYKKCCGGPAVNALPKAAWARRKTGRTSAAHHNHAPMVNNRKAKGATHPG